MRISSHYLEYRVEVAEIDEEKFPIPCEIRWLQPVPGTVKTGLPIGCRGEEQNPGDGRFRHLKNMAKKTRCVSDEKCYRIFSPSSQILID